LELEALVDMLERVARRHEQVPQPRRLRLRLQLLDDCDRLPPVALGELRLIVAGARTDPSLDELADASLEESLPFRKVKVHGSPPLVSGAPSLCRKRRFRASIPWISRGTPRRPRLRRRGRGPRFFPGGRRARRCGR